MMADRFKTPITGKKVDENFDHVYEPAEDTFLLLDVLEQEDSFLQVLSPSICLEIGCGSGVCITFLSQMLLQPALCLCTDINRKAALMAKETSELNRQTVEPVLCYLSSALERRLARQVDVLLFNPPYVVTPSEEVANDGIEASWAGGIKGREVLDKFLPRVKELLSPEGVFYLVIIEENDPDEIQSIMAKEGFQTVRAATRRAGRELLSVLKLTRLKCK